MKIKFDYPVKRLLGANLIYFVTFLTLNTVLLISAIFFLHQQRENSIKTDSLQAQTAKLNKKKELLEFNNQFINDEIDLADINLVLSQLIPSEDDYFSIALALEKLSLQTNFIITSYSIAINQSTTEKLAIVIEGQGDADSFLAFLKAYKFEGGRVITADKIELTEDDIIDAKININVYRGKARTIEALETLTDEDRRLIEDVLQKVKVEFKTEESVLDEYPTKSNPF